MPVRRAPIRTTVAALALLMLGGCAIPTPYAPASPGNGGGYIVQQIESNRFRVAFVGNTLTPRTTVENYALYTAAEVTLDNGYDYFLLSDRATDKSTGYTTVDEGFGGWGGGWHHGWGGWGGGDFAETYPRNSYDTGATILCFRGPKPSDPNAYDARDVMAKLGPTIVRPVTQPAAGPVPAAPPPPASTM